MTTIPPFPAPEPRPGAAARRAEQQAAAEAAREPRPPRPLAARPQRFRRQRRLGRWLWQGLVLLVVVHNLTVIATTQFAPERLLTAVLVWGGAWLCLEHLLPRLRPRPDWWGLALGSLLLGFSWWRSARILVPDGLIYLLVPLQGLALAWLVLPRRQLARLWRPLLVLLLLPVSVGLLELMPERMLTLLAAHLGQAWLLLAGLPALVDGQRLWLGAGGVTVVGGCSGAYQLLQVAIVMVILQLAFPLALGLNRLLLVLLPPLVTLLINGGRVALLAWLNRQGQAQLSWEFMFVHDQAGALLIGGLAMTLTVLLHVGLVERELRQLEAEAAALAPPEGPRIERLPLPPPEGSRTHPSRRRRRLRGLEPSGCRRRRSLLRPERGAGLKARRSPRGSARRLALHPPGRLAASVRPSRSARVSPL